MKYSIPSLAVLILLWATPSLLSQPTADKPSSHHYGAWDSTAGATLDLSRVMTDSTYHNRSVMVEGEVLDVCRKKGCWVMIGDGTSQMRVTFKDYSFFVPTDCDGRKVRLQGVVTVEEIPEDLAKHYAEESKSESAEEIVGAQREITMVATGVEIVVGE